MLGFAACDTPSPLCSWLRGCFCRRPRRRNPPACLSEQSESTGHLNPVVAKLAAGRTVYGLINTGDLSLANARETARAPVDFVYADMEHSPLDFPGLAIFLAGLTDKAAIVAKKSAQPNVALLARFPPEADQSQWVVKQALDIGLMGVIFNGVDTKDQALTAVRTMRYPPMRGATRREPVGIRGYSTAAASYAWGVSAAEYERRADVWPLNPDGDLLAVVMIESVEGLENVDADRERSRCRRAVSRRRLRPLTLDGRPRQLARGRSRVSAGAESLQRAQGGVRHHRRQRERRHAPCEGRLEDHPVNGASDYRGPGAARRSLTRRDG